MTNGYRDYAQDLPTEDGGQYAYNMAGAHFGDPDGIYVGAASYYNTGALPITTPTTQVYSAGLGDEHFERGERLVGAPHGPYTVCIADVTTPSASPPPSPPPPRDQGGPDLCTGTSS